MKTKIFFLGAIATLSMASCDDFLDTKNTSSLNGDEYYNTADEINSATAPLYNYVWNDFNGKLYYSMGDGRSNNITAQWSDYIKVYTNFNESSLSEGLFEAWHSLYSVAAQTGTILDNITKSSAPETAKVQGMAECRFMRGVAYWYLASLWGNVPLYNSTSDLINDYAVKPTRQADVMEFAIRDLEYAAANLPTTAAATGRVNKYAAFAMLSRVYLSMAGITTNGAYDGNNIATDYNRGSQNPYYLDLAKRAARKVIAESNYKLMDNYADLFMIDNNNCAEDIFQLQWLKGSTDAIGWGCNQDITAFFGWSTMVTDGTNWGGATCCSWDLYQEFLEEEGDQRMHECVAAYGFEYPYINVRGGGYVYGVTENPSTNGANIKKYVVGTNADNGVSFKQSSGINTHMIRLAEVYLNYAEAALGEAIVQAGSDNKQKVSTDDPEALRYFNAVRQRAGLAPKASFDYSQLRHERRLELAFEGQYWYDLVRRAYFQQQEVVNYLNNQDRNRTYKYNTDSGVYEPSENPGTGVATATAASMLLPYPDSDQNKNPYLKNNTGDTATWTFGDREVDINSLM